MRRLIIGEAARFPELARRYYELVPARVFKALAEAFSELRLDDPNAAARHFAWLTLGLPLDRGMLYPVKSAMEGANLDEMADSAVRVFLAGYGNR